MKKINLRFVGAGTLALRQKKSLIPGLFETTGGNTAREVGGETPKVLIVKNEVPNHGIAQDGGWNWVEVFPLDVDYSKIVNPAYNANYTVPGSPVQYLPQNFKTAEEAVKAYNALT